jgi:hypothetical protein
MYKYTGLLYDRPVRRDLVSKEKRPTVAVKETWGDVTRDVMGLTSGSAENGSSML